MFSLVLLQPYGSDDQWLKRRKHSTLRWRRKLHHWLKRPHKKGEEEEDYDEYDEELELDWDFISEEQPEPWERDTQVGTLGFYEG